MKKVQVYGSGCKNCIVTAERFAEVAQELGLQVNIEKVTSLEAIFEAGIMSTPGVAIDGEIKHTGSVPSVDLVRDLLKQDVIA
ncbi:thioredoxin family protein [Vibrio panuliri]|uniref:Redox-active disulfide protein 2 n=1 Tax=Vibrio panuliri TaxID=1381081 RepID=A0ABX3FBV9_9VIBR|nr:thioredoxin family protein [Vibrio panuliri]KAB1458265.1 thioredoxin family protein [Vibrio panuliri]OLQ86822.1 redox-active disulfide protein 2 [Vibrio panuliri]